MAELTCTIEEFHRFIGPRIRNVIQSLTKKRKKELNYICQGCNQRDELEAAHVKGSERKVICEKVLEKYVDNEGIIRIDLDKIEGEIIANHKPIDKYFKFLCSKCHAEYHSKKRLIKRNKPSMHAIFSIHLRHLSFFMT